MTTYNLSRAETKLKNLGEEHLLRDWVMLSDAQKGVLLKEIQTLDTQTFKQQQYALKNREQKTVQSWGTI